MSTTCSKLRHRAGPVGYFCQIRKAFTPLDALVVRLVLPLISPSGPFTPLSRTHLLSQRPKYEKLTEYAPSSSSIDKLAR